MNRLYVAVRRTLLMSALALGLGGCTTPLQTSTFSVLKTSGGTYVYPPGPETSGELNILVEGVAKPSNGKCKDLPFGSVNGNNEFSLHIDRHFLSGTLVRTAVIGMAESLRHMERHQVQAKLEAYLKDLVKNETAKACLKDGATAAILTKVLDSLPVNTTNVLRDVAGYDAKNNMVEVRPGQQLCVSSGQEITQFLPDEERKRAWFAAGAQHCYPVTRFRNPAAQSGETASVIFDALLARLSKADVEVVTDNNETNSNSRWVAGPIDLNDTTALQRQAFHIIYPSSYGLYNPSEPVRTPKQLPVLVGSSCPGAHKVLASCNRELTNVCLMKDDSCITTALNKRELFTDAEAAAFQKCQEKRKRAGNWAQCYVFRDRGIPVPYINVSVNGVNRFVPVGTALIDLLEVEEPLPFEDITAIIAAHKDAFSDPATPIDAAEVEQVVWDRARWLLSNVKLSRRFGGRTYPVKIEGFSKEVLYMPVLQGDEIKW
ncbi:MAG: hypothetical protein AB2758_17735 [Candidatus Thiodiazotropha endolucinida]